MSLPNVTKDLDLDYIYNDYDISPTRAKHFTYFINLLLSNNKTKRVCQASMEKIFEYKGYHKITKEKLSKYNKDSMDYDKTTHNETLLFHRLFKRLEKGNNTTTNLCNLYSLSLEDKELIKVEESYNKLPFIEYIERVTKNKNKIKDFTIDNKDKRTKTNKFKFDKKHIKKYIKNNSSKYGYYSTYIDTSIKEEQYNTRKIDYQKLIQLTDIKTKDNTIDLYYDIKASGRMYTDIQGMTKEIRKELLYGYTENDISASAPNFFIKVFNQIVYEDKSILLDDYIKKYTKKKDYEKLEILNKIKLGKFDLLEDYTTNGKKNIRQLIANVIKGNNPKYKDDYYLSKSKEILTMIFFGAKTNKPTVYTDLELDIIDNVIQSKEEVERVIHTAISNVLTKEERERFYNDSLVKEFLLHSEILMDIISQYLKNYHFKDNILRVNNQVLDFNQDTEYYYKIDNKKHIINSSDYSEIIDNKILIENTYHAVKETIRRYSKSKALAFFYQSWESNTLLEIEEVYLQNCTKEADKRYLLIHDGIYTKIKIDKELLENLRSSNNTFNVRYKIEQ